MTDQPRWTEPLQNAADDLFLAARAAASKHDLSYNDVMIAMVMAAAKFSPEKHQRSADFAMCECCDGMGFVNADEDGADDCPACQR